MKSLCLWIALALLAARTAPALEDRDMVIESLDGDVTTNEYQSFIDKLPHLPPPPTNNIDNAMVDERPGARLHGMQTFYAFTHDRRVLDMAIVWSDAFLHARNDPTNGRITWTGQRDLCWPNKDPNDKVWAWHSSSENGDVIEHIVNTARLILENPAVWNLAAPPDKFGFGATYLDRAKTYVRECQRSAETTLVPWFVRNTRDGYRLYYPESAAFFKATDGNESGPIPWNQQQEIVGALLRLAQCHRLLNDGNTNIAYYEKITADAAAWFFANALPTSVSNRVCYLWSYGLPRDPAVSPEVTYESDYDMFIFRAYEANLGPTRLQMQRLINTGRYLMYLGTNRVSGYINGTSDNNSSRHERNYFSFEWIEMSVLDRDFYRLLAGNIVAIHEYWDNLAIEAAVLSAKHFWATTTNPPAEIIEDASAFQPRPQASGLTPRSIARHTPAAGFLLLLWLVSELLLMVQRRLRAGPTPFERRLSRTGWLVNLASISLGITAAYTFRAGRIYWQLVPDIGMGLFLLGVLVRWYAALRAGPYRDTRRTGAAGRLLTVLGLGLAMRNWASILILFLPNLALTYWFLRPTPSPALDKSESTAERL